MKTVFLILMIVSKVAIADSDTEVKACLSNWKKTPFNIQNPNYRTISASVNVFGVGKDIEDSKKTESPELVYIKPSVNVLGKNTMKLLNPNGWYCLKSNTNVLGKATIELHCNAHLTMSNSGATVLGSNDSESGASTTVLGKTKIKRVGCQ